eukprot:g10172.t1
MLTSLDYPGLDNKEELLPNPCSTRSGVQTGFGESGQKFYIDFRRKAPDEKGYKSEERKQEYMELKKGVLLAHHGKESTYQIRARNAKEEYYYFGNCSFYAVEEDVKQIREEDKEIGLKYTRDGWYETARFCPPNGKVWKLFKKGKTIGEAEAVMDLYIRDGDFDNQIERSSGMDLCIRAGDNQIERSSGTYTYGDNQIERSSGTYTFFNYISTKNNTEANTGGRKRAGEKAANSKGKKKQKILGSSYDDKKLKKFLKPIPLTSHDNYVKEKSDKHCRETRHHIFEEIAKFRGRNENSGVFILEGNAGTGKSVIASRLCELEKLDVLANFFCRRDISMYCKPKAILRTIAYCMANRLPAYKAALKQIDIDIKEIEGYDVTSLFLLLIIEPLSKKQCQDELKDRVDKSPRKLLIVIDALDESEMDDGENKLLECILEYAARIQKYIVFFVSTRPVMSINGAMEMFQNSEKTGPKTLSLTEKENRNDIKTYIHVWMKKRKKKNNRFAEEILKKSHGSFLYVYFVLKQWEKENFKVVPELPNGIQDFYKGQFKHILGFSVQEEKPKMWKTLETIVVSEEPLHRNALEEIVDYEHPSGLTRKLEKLSILFPVRDDKCVHCSHKSVKDFLTDKDQSEWRVIVDKAHKELGSRCVTIVQELTRYGEKTQKYAITFGITHLLKSDSKDKLLDAVLNFEWLLNRAMYGPQYGLTIHDLIKDLNRVKMKIKKTNEDDWKAINLLQRAIKLSQQALEFDPRQLAGQLIARLLGFETKEKSRLSQLICEIRKWKGLEGGKGWWQPVQQSFTPVDGALELTLTGHSNAVLSVSINCTKTKIASGSRDCTIRIWDVHTGRCEYTQDHQEWINSVQFSPKDENLLAYGCGDGTIYIWNLPEPEPTQVNENQEKGKEYSNSAVYSLAFHPEGKIIASGLRNGTIQLWNIIDRRPISELSKHKSIVRSINFDMKGDLIVSGSKDKKTIVWNWKERKEARTFNFESEVHCVAFYYNYVVSALGNGEVRIDQNETFVKLDTKTKIRSFDFNGTKFVCAADDNKLRLLDCSKFPESKHLHMFETSSIKSVSKTGKNWNQIYSVAFFYSNGNLYMVSGSWDYTISIWNSSVDCHTILLNETNHQGGINQVAYSPCGKRFLSVSDDRTVRVWDAKTGKLKHKFMEHKEPVRCLTFTPDGRLAISGSRDKTIRMWDFNTGKEKKVFKHEDRIICLFAAENKQDRKEMFASGSDKGTVSVYIKAHSDNDCDWAKKEMNEKHEDEVYSIAFHPNELQVASGSKDKNIFLWDIKTGSFLRKLDGHTDTVRSIAFNFNGKKIVSGSWDKSIRIWEKRDSWEPFKIRKDFKYIVNNVSFSKCGKYILVASGSKRDKYGGEPADEIIHVLNEDDYEIKFSGPQLNDDYRAKLSDSLQHIARPIPEKFFFKNEKETIGLSGQGGNLQPLVYISPRDIDLAFIRDTKNVHFIKRSR